MCPISAFMQFLILVVAMVLFGFGAIVQAADWRVACSPSKQTLHMYETANITCNVTGPPTTYSEYKLLVESNDQRIVKAKKEIWLLKPNCSETFNIQAQFLGKVEVGVRVQQRGSPHVDAETWLNVVVIRQVKVIHTVFHASVAILVSIMYVNFGCALKWGDLRNTLTRPIGPVIGFVGQFLFMPLISYGLGKLLFPNNIPMQLGMFFTGVSPGGGASNMWTVILGGNIDLSITMTTISTFAAFAMMPLWLFTLGRMLFEEGKMEVPYSMISKYAVALVIPLFIGFLIQRFLPKVSHFLVRILKTVSSLLIIFIIIFAIVTNLYLFELFSWQIVVAGLGLPWFGYAFAYLIASILKQPYEDCLAIAIETGIQNTGISIFLLRFTLAQPEADLTTVMPVSVAIMTPLPLLCLYIFKEIRSRCWVKHSKLDASELNSPLSELDYDNNLDIKGPKCISISTLS